MNYLAILFAALMLQVPTPGQPGAPGTIVQTKTYSFAITAGAMRCTMITATAGAAVQFYCYTGTTLVFNTQTTISGITDLPNGPHVSYSLGLDTVGAMWWRTAADKPVQWQIVANGTMQSGTF